jgi:hypothetical protein
MVLRRMILPHTQEDAFTGTMGLTAHRRLNLSTRWRGFFYAQEDGLVIRGMDFGTRRSRFFVVSSGFSFT